MKLTRTDAEVAGGGNAETRRSQRNTECGGHFSTPFSAFSQSLLLCASLRSPRCVSLAAVFLLIVTAGRCAAADEIPVAKFTDINREAGITFTHLNGAYGDKLLPETMGGGVAFLDYDNDGRQDLLFINSTYWPGTIPPGKPPPTMALYHNNGRGRFTDVTAGSGLDVSCYGTVTSA